MNGEQLLLVLDAGTSSTRALLYALDGQVVGTAQREITQHYPQPGWVEHDGEEIWERTLACAREMVEQAGGGERIAGIGMTNQRETALAWDRTSGRALTRAIVWQDRRTAEQCGALRNAGHEATVQRQTGLVLDPYFSATKWRWMMDHVPAVRDAGARLALGTVESWLLFKLTGGAHLSDATNASRTLLLPLDAAQFDPALCDLFGVQRGALPEVVDTSGSFGTSLPEWFGTPTSICGMVGDQQSATLGEGCLEPGDTKATFGTGAFILTATGEVPQRSRHRLLSTVLSQTGGKRRYALEGSVFVAGSMIKWLRDGMGWISHAAETDALARAYDNGGVTVVPALAGLGAPHWRPDATAAILGLTLGTRKEQIVRAALESVAHQCRDLQQAFAADGASWRSLHIDGAMSANDWLAQDLADMLDIRVERPADVESTARGAAMLAGVGAGLFASLEEAKRILPSVTNFTPEMPAEQVEARMTAWCAGLQVVLAAAPGRDGGRGKGA